MSKSKLSESDVKHLATLSALQLTDEESIKLMKQFEETLEYVENLKDLDTSKVNTSHITQTENVFFEDGEKCDRMLSQEEAVANGKHVEKGEFVVEKIL